MPFFISFSRFFFRACKLKFEKDQKIETEKRLGEREGGKSEAREKNYSL